MRILFLSSMALFPETRFGGAKRLYYFARELEKRSELSLICVDGCREWQPGSATPGEFRRSLYLDLGGLKSAARRLFSLPVAIDEEVARHRGSIEAFLGEGGFDATLLAFPLSLTFLGQGWDARMGRKVYLEDDLLLESYRGEALGADSLLGRAKGVWRHRQALTYFRTKLADASAFVCISSEEREVIREVLPHLDVPVLKYGLPLEDFAVLPAGDPCVLGFIGNYRHAPNLDAALWLAESVFPQVTAALPEARLVLAGRDIPGPLRAACARQPSIRLWEDVEDLAAFYREIGIFINPIRQGRGLRTKVVEAAAFGRPVLSTRLGAEGLEDLSLPIWESPSELPARLGPLRDPATYRSLADANRKVVERRYSIASLGESLFKVLVP